MQLSSVEHTMCLTCDVKPHRYRYIECNSHTQACHFMCIEELAESIKKTGRALGHCARHKKICEILANLEPDLMTAGFECKAFTQARTGRRKSGTKDHPTALLWEPMMVLVAFLQPLALLLENVWGMAMAERAGPGGDPVSPLERMLATIVRQQPSYKPTIFVVNGCTFLTM